MAGLFFCLASAEGAGLLFCPFAIHPHTSVYSGFLYHPWLYTANAVKPRTGLCRRFSCDLSHSTAADTRPTQAAIIPPVQRWSVSQRPDGLHRYQIPPPRRKLHSSTQPPIIIRYIRSASLLWIHARRCNIPQTMPARRGHLLPCVDLWQVLHPAHLLRGSASPPVQGQPGGLQSSTGQRSGRTSWYPPPGGAVQQQERGGAARNH